jgi:hypothetical protein
MDEFVQFGLDPRQGLRGDRERRHGLLRLRNHRRVGHGPHESAHAEHVAPQT